VGEVKNDLTLDTIVPILRHNESVLQTYQGTVCQTEFHLVRESEGGYVRREGAPTAMIVTDTEFVHDRSRGEDYWAQMHYSSDWHDWQHPYNLERRNGASLETLVMDESREPTLGIIAPISHGVYVTHSPRNMRARSDLFVLTSAEEQRFISSPLSSLCDGESGSRAWLYPDEYDVAGHPCYKIAVMYPCGKGARLAFVMLGKDVNLCIVRQQSTPVAREEFENLDWALSRFDSVFDYLSRLESFRPGMLIVCNDYHEVSPGVWIPETTISYAISSLHDREVAALEEEDHEFIINARDSDPHTAHLDHVVVRGYHVFKLDMDSLRINEPIDPATFEASIIPSGVPVSNFLLNIHPGDTDPARQVQETE